MAKFYIKIQRNVEFSITETVEDHQTNQNKNENKDKKARKLQTPNPDSHQENISLLYLLTNFLPPTPV